MGSTAANDQFGVGIAALIGIACCLVAAATALPAALKLIEARGMDGVQLSPQARKG